MNISVSAYLPWRPQHYLRYTSTPPHIKMMMARPYVVAAVCVALWCGVAFGQEAQPADDAQDNKADTDPATGQQPNEATESKTMSTASTTTTTTERTNAAGGDASPSDGLVEEEAKMEGKEVMVDDEEGDEDEDDDEEEEVEEDYVENEEVADAEASPSMDKKNGAATMSVSLSSLMIATVLAKMYAH